MGCPRLEAVPRLWGWQGRVDTGISLCPCCPRPEEEDGSKQGQGLSEGTSSSCLALEPL